ncbi:MAG: tRNA (adenosine(37)-N6)-dimethylallyltransferase MiaA [Anaerolineaceae bacterium]
MTEVPAPKLLILVGATGSGKSALAIKLAHVVDAEIISADSRYLYRDLNIGTAKPPPQELASVPHHLVDVTDLDNPWSLGLYQQEAHRFILDINKRGKLPLLVGGTGQYIRAILQNWEVPSQIPVETLRTAIEAWGEEIGFQTLHQKLSLIDPRAAKAIDFRNKRRTIRALEVIFSTGQRFSDLRTKTQSPYHVLTIGIDWPRNLLYQRIDHRIEEMMQQGFIDEVRSLKEQSYTEALKHIGIIGYTEISDYLDGLISRDAAIMLIKRNTRVYVRRQANWFKPTDPTIHWFNATDPAMFENMLDLINAFLAT